MVSPAASDRLVAESISKTGHGPMAAVLEGTSKKIRPSPTVTPWPTVAPDEATS
jgi:hypothetical protein